jgi:hypothetical protein
MKQLKLNNQASVNTGSCALLFAYVFASQVDSVRTISLCRTAITMGSWGEKRQNILSSAF